MSATPAVLLEVVESSRLATKHRGVVREEGPTKTEGLIGLNSTMILKMYGKFVIKRVHVKYYSIAFPCLIGGDTSRD